MSSLLSSLCLAANGFQAGAGGFMKIHVSTRTKLTYEDTCFLAEAKAKNCPDEAKRGGF
ncbi:MAG: hypothetical protein ACK5QC_17060 [Bacteroidota bacterium]